MENNVFIQAKVTKTAAFSGAAFDSAPITGDYTVFIRVIDLVGTARFVFEDSGDNFAADALPGPTFSMKGVLGKDYTVTKSFLRRDFPSLRVGTAGAKIRLKLAELTGSGTQTCTYEAWIQY